MAEEHLRDGKRIAQLLASEVEGVVDGAAVVDAERDVEPTDDGAFAYAVARSGVDGDGESTSDESDDTGSGNGETDDTHRFAEVYVQPDRARVEFLVAPDVAAERAEEAGLRVRPKAVRPPRTLVFVEDGAQVKWIVPVVERVVDETKSTA